MIRHLHRDYDTAHCGEDASHILMAYDPAESDCAACHAAKDALEAKQKRAAAREEARLKRKADALREERRKQHEAAEAAAEERELARLQVERALGLRP